MAYLIPSSIQKRLLRYVLSRLELLDTDALDLDKLEIGWGRKSTIELKDVTLRTAKIVALLQLPNGILVENASVAHFRMSVPADLHSSSILVEVSGVDVKAKLHDDGSIPKRPPKGPRQSQGPVAQKSPLPRRPRSPPLRRNPMSDEHSSDEEAEVLLNPHDLAASFLEERPLEERVQLKEAMRSQTLDTQQPITSSDGMDDEVGYGIGVEFSLPAFLAGFIKGVVERLQVSIKDVTVTMEIQLELPVEEKSRYSEDANPSPTAIALHVDEVTLHEAEHATNADAAGSESGQDQQPETDATQVSHTGKRCISLIGLTGSLVSEAAALTQLSHILGNSPEGRRGTWDSTTSSAMEESRNSLGHSEDVSTSKLLASQRSQRTSGDPLAQELFIPTKDDIPSSLQPKRPDATDDESPPTGLANSEAFEEFESTRSLRSLHIDGSGHEGEDESIAASSGILPQDIFQSLAMDPSVGQSQHSHTALASFRRDRLSVSRHELESDQDQRGRTVEMSTGGSARLGQAHFAKVPGGFESDSVYDVEHEPETGLLAAETTPDDLLASFSDSDSQTPIDEGLTQSRLFSHEEAESIYMSVMGDSSQNNSEKIHMPGGWEESDTLEFFDSLDSPLEPQKPSEHQSEQPNSISAVDDVQAQPSSEARIDDFLAPEPVNSVKQETTQHEERPPQSPETPTIPLLSNAVATKEILNVSKIQIWLPLNTTETDDVEVSNISENESLFQQGSTHAMTESVYGDVPGAFSIYAESRTASTSGHSKPETSKGATKSFTGPLKEQEPVEVLVDSVSGRIDIATARLVVQLSQKLVGLFSNTTRPEKVTKNVPSAPSASKNPGTSFTVGIHQFRMGFFEAFGAASFLRSTVSESGSLKTRQDLSDGALFLLNIEDLDANVRQVLSTICTRLEIARLRVGFADSDILCFNREGTLKTSLVDVREVHDKDISMEINQSSSLLEMHIATQPVRVLLDIQRIDNTLGSLGGLSGLLELGSSVMSDSTIVPSKAATQQSKAVRFDSSTKIAPEFRNSSQTRINVKLSGILLTLKGKDCSISYQTTSVKVVARSTIIGVQINEMRLRGPIARIPGEYTPIVIKVRDTRLQYLFAPEEKDLTRLISLLTPSKDKFEEDDDVLVETLIRQRRKGTVLRTNIAHVEIEGDDYLAIEALNELGREMSKLSAVTRYLPQESRPGTMILSQISTISVKAQAGPRLGQIHAKLSSAELAHVTCPSLVALAVRKIDAVRDDVPVIRAMLPQDSPIAPPMFMTRMIEDELEPTIKVKLWNTCFEYSVALVMSAMNLKEDQTEMDVELDLTQSIAALAERPKIQKSNTQSSDSSDRSKASSKAMKVDVACRDCAIGLTPRRMNSKGLFVLTDTRVTCEIPDNQGLTFKVDLRKAELLLVDDVNKLSDGSDPSKFGRSQSYEIGTPLIMDLCSRGYVCVTSISAANIGFRLSHSAQDETSTMEVLFKDELFVLETCADSTQTLINTLNGLKPPMPPSKGERYRTQVAPVQDMMASFTGDAFAIAAQDVNFRSSGETSDYVDDEADLYYAGEFTDEEPEFFSDDIEGDFGAESGIFGDLADLDYEKIDPDTALPRQQETIAGGFQPKSLPPKAQGTAHRWDSTNNRYKPLGKVELVKCPLKVEIKDMHIIWNLYDGYDWQRTREEITKAVQDIEYKAEKRRQSRRTAIEDDQDEESVIGDFLFNSIYIGIPANHDPRELSRQINHNIDDLVSETASQTPSHTSSARSRPLSSQRSRSRGRKLKLERSKRHKITFELRGVCLDFFLLPPGEETQSSTDVRIHNFEIFDHVPTSTWRKFATYMHDSGPREDKKPMIHLEICDVRPVPELTATELVIRATVLPVRLHVDQDALDFITRFFEFNDDSSASGTPSSEQPYLQRVEVFPVPVKLDYKPKKVDYAGLRSGRTNEFMNFFILDGADFVLKHVVLYGTSGFIKLHRSLEDIWMPDVKRNQLPSVLSGLNGVRSLVNAGSGVRDLITIPIREYQRDGRIVRSISKGALAFAKQTGGELTRFGAKLAVGTHAALQGAEGFLAKSNQQRDPGWDDTDLDLEEEKRAISNYANQPVGILQGLKGAARSLERDLLVTRDAIVAVSGEVKDSGSAEGAMAAVAKTAPTIILRPMIGASKAISQTLMGAANTMDPDNKRRIEDKYKPG